ncbi:MAG: hypothetical protein R2848_07550 [Thermomicrobiales bacterium]
MEQDNAMTFTLSYDSGNPLKVEADALILPIRTDASGELIFAGATAEANSSLKGELRQLAADARFKASRAANWSFRRLAA